MERQQSGRRGEQWKIGSDRRGCSRPCRGVKSFVRTLAFTQLNFVRILPNPPIEPEMGSPDFFCVAQSSES